MLALFNSHMKSLLRNDWKRVQNCATGFVTDNNKFETGSMTTFLNSLGGSLFARDAKTVNSYCY